jgi:hypothetical protein
MRQDPTSASRDLLNAFFYVVALGVVLALIVGAAGVALVRIPPGLLGGTAQAETSGSGAQGEVDARFAPWRITPEEAQRRFATRSSALFPPTRFPQTPENWSPPYAAMARKHALKDPHGEARAHASARDISRARHLGVTNAPLSTAQNSPVVTSSAMVDPQMGGR